MDYELELLSGCSECCNQPPCNRPFFIWRSLDEECEVEPCGEYGEGECPTLYQTINRDFGGRQELWTYTLEQENPFDPCSEKRCKAVITCSGEQTETITYSTAEGFGEFHNTISCSGSQVTTTIYSGTIVWYPDEGDGSDECESTLECSGSLTATIQTTGGFPPVTETETCSETFGEDCNWSGTQCAGYTCAQEFSYEPPSKPVETTYSNPQSMVCPICPQDVDYFPFPDLCNPSTPSFGPRQGENQFAYDFSINDLGITLRRKIKAKIAHEFSGTCYMKVWIYKQTQSYRLETEGCNKSWVIDGDPTYQEIDQYTWLGSSIVGNRCFDTTKGVAAPWPNVIIDGGNCVNFTMSSAEFELMPEIGKETTILMKWSCLEGYEPDNPWLEDRQNPDGYPNIND